MATFSFDGDTQSHETAGRTGVGQRLAHARERGQAREAGAEPELALSQGRGGYGTALFAPSSYSSVHLGVYYEQIAEKRRIFNMASKDVRILCGAHLCRYLHQNTVVQKILA